MLQLDSGCWHSVMPSLAPFFSKDSHRSQQNILIDASFWIGNVNSRSRRKQQERKLTEDIDVNVLEDLTIQHAVRKSEINEN